MSPEQHLAEPYVGAQVDMFAGGVVIFTMLAGHFPFQNANAKDDQYKYFAHNKSKKFWAQMKQHSEVEYSKEFRHFFSSLVQFEAT